MAFGTPTEKFNETQNKAIVNNIIDELKLNPITDDIPKVVVPSIQPTFEVKRKVINIVRSTFSSASGTPTTPLTTSSTQDTYLVGLTASYIKDATCDVATGAINVACTIDGTAQNLLRFSVLTLTAQENCVAISFPTPIKVDRNTTINFTSNTFTAGTLARALSIMCYTEEAGNNLSV